MDLLLLIALFFLDNPVYLKKAPIAGAPVPAEAEDVGKTRPPARSLAGASGFYIRHPRFGDLSTKVLPPTMLPSVVV